MAYFEQLKSSDTGWQLATNTLINTNAAGPSLNDHVKFFALQVIEVFIKQSYQKSSPSQQQAMKHFLSQWIQLQVLMIIILNNRQLMLLVHLERFNILYIVQNF